MAAFCVVEHLDVIEHITPSIFPRDVDFSLDPFPFQKLRDVLKIGLPSAAEQISYDASQVTIVYFINMLGNEYLTARVYVMNIVIIGYIFSLSIAQVTSICTGNLLGARKKQAAYLLSWYAWRRSLLITLVASTGVYLLGRPLLGIFTENQAIITIAMGALLVDVLLNGNDLCRFILNVIV